VGSRSRKETDSKKTDLQWETKMIGETLTLSLPAPLAHELGAATQEFVADLLTRGLREVKIERALDRYAHGGMSFGAAARQAGVSQTDLSRFAYARGLEPPFSAQTLAEELSESA
jgi:hypothetical protein